MRREVVRRTVRERLRDKYVRLQVRGVCVAYDKIAEPRVGDHRSGTRIETLVLPKEAVSSPQSKKLPGDDILESLTNNRTPRMTFGQTPHKEVHIVNVFKNGFEAGLQSCIGRSVP